MNNFSIIQNKLLTKETNVINRIKNKLFLWRNSIGWYTHILIECIRYFILYFINIDDKSGWPSSWGSFNFCVLHFYTHLYTYVLWIKKTTLTFYFLQTEQISLSEMRFLQSLFLYIKFSDWNIRRKQTLDLLWKLLLPVVNCDDYWILLIIM